MNLPNPAAEPRGPRVGFLVIGRKRPGFDVDWAAQMEEAAWTAVKSMQLDTFRPQTRAVDDGSIRAAVKEIHDAACDTVVVLQPTMGDGRLAPVLAQQFPYPVVFWATPERPGDGKVSSCSLVGAHAFASIFRQLDRPFELAYGDPDNQDTLGQLIRAVRLCSAAARLRRAKVGLVGQHVPGFSNMATDPAQLFRQLGVVLQHVGLEEFFELIESCDDGAVEADVKRVTDLGLPMDESVASGDLEVGSRCYLAMQRLLDDENLDAMALRCWPEMPGRVGHWPYLAMSRLGAEGRVVALEGDADGAVGCLIGSLLGVGPAYVSDWLDHDAKTLTLWHPGHAPFEICRPESVRLDGHFNNRIPLVVNATLAVDRPITIFRLWRCDDRYQITAREARTATPRRELLGANGLAVIDDLDVHCWFESLCHAGMPHHVIVLPGHHTDLLKRFARLMRVDWFDG